MESRKKNKKKANFLLKRMIDLLCSFIGLMVFAPVLFILILLVWFNFGRPVFFTQERLGLHAKPFKVIKFRTMTNACDSQGHLLPDQMRTSKIGRFIRKNSLDEIPEFINVIKGDMSLVGPRPLLVKYLPYFTERENKRHNIRPGITGLAQVNGRNLLTWDERLEMDVQYLDNFSIWLDFKILFLTIVNVITQRDVLAVSSEFIPDFDDYRKNQSINKFHGS